VLGARPTDEVGEGGVLDLLVLGGEPVLMLPLVFRPGGHLELFEEGRGFSPTPYSCHRLAPERSRDRRMDCIASMNPAWRSASTVYSMDTTIGPAAGCGSPARRGVSQ